MSLTPVNDLQLMLVDWRAEEERRTDKELGLLALELRLNWSRGPWVSYAAGQGRMCPRGARGLRGSCAGLQTQFLGNWTSEKLECPTTQA